MGKTIKLAAVLLAGEMAEGVPEFKIVVVGESGVGKSCIVSSFSGDEEAGGQFINILSF